MAAGDGTFMLRDTFSVHEGRETNWCVSRIFIHLTADAHSVALPQFVAQHGEATFREAALIWAVDYIERGLRGARFREGSNRSTSTWRIFSSSGDWHKRNAAATRF
jgi:hypothetical protein